MGQLVQHCVQLSVQPTLRPPNQRPHLSLSPLFDPQDRGRAMRLQIGRRSMGPEPSSLRCKARALVSAEQIAGEHAVGHVLQVRGQPVRHDQVGARLERGQVADHLGPEELCVGKGGFKDHDL